MEQIAISEFKAKCLAILEQVRKTRKPVLVTRRGLPVAEIVPPALPKPPKNWLGSFANTGQITGDIVSPATEPTDWEVLR